MPFAASSRPEPKVSQDYRIVEATEDTEDTIVLKETKRSNREWVDR